MIINEKYNSLLHQTIKKFNTVSTELVVFYTGDLMILHRWLRFLHTTMISSNLRSVGRMLVSTVINERITACRFCKYISKKQEFPGPNSRNQRNCSSWSATEMNNITLSIVLKCLVICMTCLTKKTLQWYFMIY